MKSLAPYRHARTPILYPDRENLFVVRCRPPFVGHVPRPHTDPTPRSRRSIPSCPHQAQGSLVFVHPRRRLPSQSWFDPHADDGLQQPHTLQPREAHRATVSCPPQAYDCGPVRQDAAGRCSAADCADRMCTARQILQTPQSR